MAKQWKGGDKVKGKGGKRKGFRGRGRKRKGGKEVEDRK